MRQVEGRSSLVSVAHPGFYNTPGVMTVPDDMVAFLQPRFVLKNSDSLQIRWVLRDCPSQRHARILLERVILQGAAPHAQTPLLLQN